MEKEKKIYVIIFSTFIICAIIFIGAILIHNGAFEDEKISFFIVDKIETTTISGNTEYSIIYYYNGSGLYIVNISEKMFNYYKINSTYEATLDYFMYMHSHSSRYYLLDK